MSTPASVYRAQNSGLISISAATCPSKARRRRVGTGGRRGTLAPIVSRGRTIRGIQSPASNKRISERLSPGVAAGDCLIDRSLGQCDDAISVPSIDEDDTAGVNLRLRRSIALRGVPSSTARNVVGVKKVEQAHSRRRLSGRLPRRRRRHRPQRKGPHEPKLLESGLPRHGARRSRGRCSLIARARPAASRRGLHGR